jgi:hypothetical protein
VETSLGWNTTITSNGIVLYTRWLAILSFF